MRATRTEGLRRPACTQPRRAPLLLDGLEPVVVLRRLLGRDRGSGCRGPRRSVLTRSRASRTTGRLSSLTCTPTAAESARTVFGSRCGAFRPRRRSGICARGNGSRRPTPDTRLRYRGSGTRWRSSRSGLLRLALRLSAQGLFLALLLASRRLECLLALLLSLLAKGSKTFGLFGLLPFLESTSGGFLLFLASLLLQAFYKTSRSAGHTGDGNKNATNLLPSVPAPLPARA